MARIYCERVANLREALAQEDCKAEAAEIMRTLIDTIELTPVCRDGKETLSITLHGHLAGILGLAAKAKGRSMRATLWWILAQSSDALCDGCRRHVTAARVDSSLRAFWIRSPTSPVELGWRSCR